MGLTGGRGHRWGVALLGAGRRAAWRRRVLRRGLSAVLAGAAVLGLVGMARTPEGGPRTTVVVVAADLPAGHVLAPSDLLLQDRPARFAPARPLRDPAEVVGRPLATPLTGGEVLTAGRVLGQGLLEGRPSDVRAVHVPVADPGALAMVRPGDLVDLLASTGEAVVADVTVLSTDPVASSGTSSLTGAGLGGGGMVVAVDDEGARRLAAAPAQDVDGTGVTVAVRPAPSLR